MSRFEVKALTDCMHAGAELHVWSRYKSEVLTAVLLRDVDDEVDDVILELENTTYKGQ